MYNSNNKTIYTAEANQTKGNTLITLGCILIIIISFVTIFFASYYNDMSSRDRESMGIVFVLLAVLFIDGLGYALQGCYIKKAYISVHDNGVTGNAVQSFPLFPIFSKSIPFDIKYTDIINVSIEGNLIITQNGRALSIPVSTSDAIQVRDFILKHQTIER